MLARIYRPAKSAMQSGAANTQDWVLEFERSAAMTPERLMGWTTDSDTSGQVRMRFDTREGAIAFARQHDIPHVVQEPRAARRVIKAYGDNFAFSRKEPWSH